MFKYEIHIQLAYSKKSHKSKKLRCGNAIAIKAIESFNEETKVMRKRQLLFVTYRDENLEEGLTYVIELAKAMFEDIILLLLREKSNLMDKLGDLMTAVSFAEKTDNAETGREDMSGVPIDTKERYEKMVASIVAKCRKEGIQVGVEETDLDAVSGIRTFLKKFSGIDKVVLSPAVTGSDNITARDLNRLVRTASRPIVTMIRQTCDGAC